MTTYRVETYIEDGNFNIEVCETFSNEGAAIKYARWLLRNKTLEGESELRECWAEFNRRSKSNISFEDYMLQSMIIEDSILDDFDDEDDEL